MEDEHMEALGAVWDALTQKARSVVMEHARACDAAIALVEEYRSPPRHSRALQTCWRREHGSLGPVLYVPPGTNQKPRLRPTFLFVEVNVQGEALEPRARAQLIVCSERRVFDEEALRFYAAHRAADFSLTMILHTGGKVASAVTQQNILRERKGTPAAPGAATGDERLAPRVEVHTHASIILHGAHAEESDYRIVPAAEVHCLKDLYGDAFDPAALPAVDARSREVMLTGALERDLVQAVEPQGVALVLVTPLADADEEHEYERLLRQLREQPELWQRREDLARRIRNAAAAECALLLERSAPGATSSDDGAKAWRALEEWVDSREFRDARGCPRLSRELFASLVGVAPSLHAKIEEALLRGEDGDAEEAWEGDLLLSALYRGFYGVRNGRAVAAWVYCHHRSLPVEEDEARSDLSIISERPGTPDRCSTPPPSPDEGASSGRTTPSPRSPADSSSERDDEISDGEEEEDPALRPLNRGEEETVVAHGDRPEPFALAKLHALLEAVDDTDDEDSAEEERDGARLEPLRAREIAFVRAMRERLSECGVRYSREEFRSMLCRVDDWYDALCANPALDRHAFWELCRGLGLPLFLASTLQQLTVGGEPSGARSLRDEIGAVEHWLQQGARSAPSREDEAARPAACAAAPAHPRPPW